MNKGIGEGYKKARTARVKIRGVLLAKTQVDLTRSRVVSAGAADLSPPGPHRSCERCYGHDLTDNLMLAHRDAEGDRSLLRAETAKYRGRELKLMGHFKQNGVWIDHGKIFFGEELGWFRLTVSDDRKALEIGLQRLGALGRRCRKLRSRDGSDQTRPRNTRRQTLRTIPDLWKT
ncbi:hypothetical protein B0H66DRAFT_533486 [Apodospora peruviana]|uniref:Uncharacterized protein n=1 Tax=Apodospora peruviana TaxID=516989 RepID=A0AAE0I5L0_9PEZI|nr:hypothetical protein B0H66DRAFT_533486 [Apodospora peruviana]